MIKKSACRNQRSKGVKVKHVLQILLLLCICFWLLYQIKCSYDRTWEMSEKVSEMLVTEDNSNGDLKLGRKDLREKQHEEEDEESKDEDEGNQGEREDAEVDEDEMRQEIERNEEFERQEGKKIDGDVEGTDNPEEDEGREEEEGSNKMYEVDDERGGDDTEINDSEVEGGETEIDRKEDFLDEDKGGREERVDDEGEEDNGEDKEERIGDDDIPEDKDPDEVGENTHESREVHYQADDASDGVAHATHGDNENADEDSNDTETGDRLPDSKAVSLNEKEREATTGNKTEANSSVSEGDKRASNVLLLAGTEFTGSRTTVTESFIDLSQTRRSAAPDRVTDDVSLEEMTVAKMENASTAEKTQNGSTMTNSGSYQTDSTPDTSNQEPMKPSDPSNNNMVHISDDVPNLDKNQEVDNSSKTPPSREVKENVIRMQVPDEHDCGKGRSDFWGLVCSKSVDLLGTFVRNARTNVQ